MFRLATVALAAGCSIKGIDLAGKACPCPSGWRCDPVQQVCTQQPATDDANPDDVHVQPAPGWTFRVLADLTGVVPYNANDFTDGTSEVLDNAPGPIAALYPPFSASFAIGAGRSIIELASDGSTTVHDYRPAAPDTTGPDNIAHLAFGAPADTGAELWIGSSSQGGGDGLFYVSPGWALVRDDTRNNLNGLGYDATGAYDGANAPAIYFIDQDGVDRRIDAADAALVLANPDQLGELAITAGALYAVQDPSATGTGQDLVRIAATTHAMQAIATATSYALAEGGDETAAGGVAVIDGAQLARFGDDGTLQPIAQSLDPRWVWQTASAPRPPHALAGSFAVVESNRALDRDRVLLFTPGG
ncbi:MAG TPA: hypothetical protein VLX92_25090 [Kofleriaceae bacterium]|nr:hypothetical protein [Kofleriaceae bacterium]